MDLTAEIKISENVLSLFGALYINEKGSVLMVFSHVILNDEKGSKQHLTSLSVSTPASKQLSTYDNAPAKYTAPL